MSLSSLLGHLNVVPAQPLMDLFLAQESSFQGPLSRSATPDPLTYAKHTQALNLSEP